MTHHEPSTTDRPANASSTPAGEPGVDARHQEETSRPQSGRGSRGPGPGADAPDAGPGRDDTTVERDANDVATPASQAWRGSNAGDPASRGTPANDSAAQDTSNATEDLAERSETSEPG